MIPIAALYQAGVALGQHADAKYLKDLKRPEYKTPKELLTAVGLSKAEYADPRFAGQSRLEAQVGQNVSQGLEAAQARGNGMAQVASLVAAGNTANQNIAAEAARQQRADLGNYQNMLRLLAQSKDTAFQLNQFAPYSDKYNELREQRGASQQNMFNALDTLSTVTNRYLSASQGNGTVVNPSQAAADASAANDVSTGNQNYIDVQLAKQMASMAKMYGPALQGYKAYQNSMYK